MLNYLILGFDEKGALTTLVWPQLHASEHASFGDEGYRDKLCSLIGKTATLVTLDAEETIVVDFDNGTEMRIPLRSYSGRGERAILTGPKHFLFVF